MPKAPEALPQAETPEVFELFQQAEVRPGETRGGLVLEHIQSAHNQAAGCHLLTDAIVEEHRDSFPPNTRQRLYACLFASLGFPDAENWGKRFPGSRQGGKQLTNGGF